MKHWAVISVNENRDYLFYAPLCAWQWKRIGCEVLLLVAGDVNKNNPAIKKCQEFGCEVFFLPDRADIDTVTYSQVSRLCAGVLSGIIDQQDIITTTDVDMLTFFVPKLHEEITLYGHDLTAYQHVPICYVTMRAKRFVDVMGLDIGDTIVTAMNKLVSRYPKTTSEVQLERWLSDQDMITDAIVMAEKQGIPIHREFRGQYENGLAVGRLDRSGWVMPETLLDCHLPRPSLDEDAFSKIMSLYRDRFKVNEILWFAEYRNRFLSYVPGYDPIFPANEWNVIDKYGMIMPWYTKPALDWILNNINPSMSVLEIGGGNSTLWYNAFGFIVKTIECDKNTAAKLRIPVLHHSEIKEHLQIEQPYDVVIVDGDDNRSDYILDAFKICNKVFIVDNWQQPGVQEYPQEVVDFLYSNSIKQTIFEQPGHPDWKTAIFEKA